MLLMTLVNLCACMFRMCMQGIGSKVLKRSGWVAGSGVGATNQGITEPVESDGQHPSNKHGLGYVCMQ